MRRSRFLEAAAGCEMKLLLYYALPNKMCSQNLTDLKGSNWLGSDAKRLLAKNKWGYTSFVFRFLPSPPISTLIYQTIPKKRPFLPFPPQNHPIFGLSLASRHRIRIHSPNTHCQKLGYPFNNTYTILSFSYIFSPPLYFKFIKITYVEKQ